MAPLGTGFPYMPSLPEGMYREGLFDFVEITPEPLCWERLIGNTVVMELAPGKLHRAQDVCGDLPIVIHGVQLSIGSAHGWNNAYLDMLEQLREVWPFQWHSEHLSFQTIAGDDGSTLEIGMPLPLPNTLEAAELIVERCQLISQRFAPPFLLENPAHYLEDRLDANGEAINDEIDLMNWITRNSPAGQLLDLHNLYCNALNRGFDPYAALDKLNLDKVGEIHLAGGSWRDGFCMDAHDSIVPEPVWEMLDYVLPRTPNVGGVVFEVLDRYASKLGISAMRRELERVQMVWRKHRPDLVNQADSSCLSMPIKQLLDV
jgi:uncharacterized protein (UPF0276 family)